LTKIKTTQQTKQSYIPAKPIQGKRKMESSDEQVEEDFESSQPFSE
jgi:hypothetical protein